jgi:hypothetical protein
LSIPVDIVFRKHSVQIIKRETTLDLDLLRAPPSPFVTLIYTCPIT